jgi:hypothetical protein
MTDNIEVTEVTEVTNLVKDDFFFRPVKKDGVLVPFAKTVNESGKEVIIDKRPKFTAELPYITGNSIVEALTDDTIEEAKKERLLKYIAGLHNDQVYGVAQAQINEAIKNNASIELSQSVLNLDALSLWSLVYAEPKSRAMFSDELIADAINDFKAVGAEFFKRPNGEQVAADKIAAAATEIFTARFKNTKSVKNALRVFQNYIAIWSVNSSRAESFISLASHLQERIDTLLNVNEESMLDKFE